MRRGGIGQRVRAWWTWPGDRCGRGPELMLCVQGERKSPSGEGLDGGFDGGLVPFECEEVVAVVVVDDVSGVLGVGVCRVGGDDLAVEVTDLIEERIERCVLGGAVRHLGFGR